MKNSSAKTDAQGAKRKQPSNGDRTSAVESRRLADLVPHPDQWIYNDPPTEEAHERLKASIARDGLRELPQVLPTNKAGLPKNTLLDGNWRVAALADLGYTTVKAVVRYDLAEADRATVDARFLSYNADRKHHDPLTRARVALRQYEIERGRSRGELSVSEYPEARDRVGLVIGMSGRNLNRYMRVLATPDEVQRAFREDRLSLVEAESVDGLDAVVQQAVADRLRAGESAKAVVAEFVACRPPSRPVTTAFVDWVGRTAKGASDIGRRLENLPPHLVRRFRQRLIELQTVTDRLLAIADGEPNAVPAD